MAVAIAASAAGASVVAVDSNSAPGKKLLITGSGRCNVTHNCSVAEFLRACEPFDRFLRHCIYEFSPADLIALLVGLGVETKTEGSGLVFPVSDRASDINNSLFDNAKSLGAKFIFGSKIDSAKKTDSGFLIESGDKKIDCQSLIIATGGSSWPQTGSDGSGYRIAEAFDHKIISPTACLVRLMTVEKWPADIAGAAAANVRVSAKISGKKISSTGPMIFTHDGIGGPAVLDFSREILNSDQCFPLDITIDFQPNTNDNDFQRLILEAALRYPKKEVSFLLADMMPISLARKICQMAGCEKVVSSQLTKQLRKNLIENVRHLPLKIKSARPLSEATITRGGVDNAEINPLTMGSNLCQNLFFAGEIINADGPCGGYNLQFAFSSGTLAGKNAAKV